MAISFSLYFTHDFKGLERQIECLRLNVQSFYLEDSPDINYISKNVAPKTYSAIFAKNSGI